MRLTNFLILMGFGFMVEFKVFLTRFMELYNTKNVKMLCLEDPRKEGKDENNEEV